MISLDQSSHIRLFDDFIWPTTRSTRINAALTPVFISMNTTFVSWAHQESIFVAAPAAVTASCFVALAALGNDLKAMMVMYIARSTCVAYIVVCACQAFPSSTFDWVSSTTVTRTEMHSWPNIIRSGILKAQSAEIW